MIASSFGRRSRRLFAWVACAAIPLLGARDARAEADAFGIGDGHNGAKIAAGAEVVNAYARVAQDVAAGATQLTIGAVVGAASGFVNGDLVLVWRATGLPASASQSPAIADRFATHVNLTTAASGVVGTFELARVQTAAASTLTLTKPLVRAFAKDVAQVVKVPEYTNVTVSAATSLHALPWAASDTGFVGGILAFMASGTVTVAGKLDADAAGFRGGAKVQRIANLPLACANEDGTPADGYANKGEGVVSAEYGATKGGRGSWSIAAGGGNCAETGGGGGANAGAGGAGGDSSLSAGRGGRGGVPLDYSLLERITLGGGGGAGEQKNGVGSSGGAGGGAIFVRAGVLAGAGAITANGVAAANAGILALESDGAGGGGAGGSVLIRTTGAAACDGLLAQGGKGGDTSVVGVGVWGPGGGGGGGRVLIQANTVTQTCAANVAAGAKGLSGATDRGAAAGQGGAAQPAPVGPFCFSNPSTTAQSQCADPQPVCDVAKGECQPCGGPFGGGAPLACPATKEPVCLASGACVPCNGDLGSTTTQGCQLASNPYCFQTGVRQGECGKCTIDGDCVGAGHPGPKCNPVAGACGTGCTTDADCKGTEWCGQNVCLPKTPNGEHLPNVPPVSGECTPANGTRTCVSAVCEESDDLCGKKNGTDCTGAPQCRSNICFDADEKCGKPSGETCTGNVECRSDRCEGGICAGCDEDVDCPIALICDSGQNQCVAGCRPGSSAAGDGGVLHGACASGQECVAIDGGAIGECRSMGVDAGASDSGGGGTPDGGASGLDAGDTFGAGLVEGGGCACRTTLASNGSPLAFAATGVVGLLLLRRRRRRRGSRR